MNNTIDINKTLTLLEATGKHVEDDLKSACCRHCAAFEYLNSSILDSIDDIGLRIRPFLLRVSSASGRINFQEILPIATGIEFIQLSTLVIDDILDQSALRNNRPSIYALKGDKEALCVGTVMSSLGFSLISEEIKSIKRKHQFPVIKLFSEVHAEIYTGQLLDICNESNTSMLEEQYYDIIMKTTSRFIQASLMAGAMLWGAPSEILDLLGEIGLALGNAYQVRDDVLDVMGESEYIGKPVAGDVRQCKMRLPVIHALSTVSKGKKMEIESYMRNSPMSKESLVKMIDLLEEAKSYDYCMQKTKEYCSHAMNLTKQLPSGLSEMKEHLSVIADILSSFQNL